YRPAQSRILKVKLVRLGRRSRRHGIAAVLAGVVTLTWVLPARPEAQPAPEYTARVLGSTEEIALASLHGRVVLLNTWATWCSPCRKEMPAFEALYREYRDQGLEIVGVNIDEGQADEQVARYVEGKGIGFPIWRDPENRFAKRFRVLGVPETFLIDRAGMIARHWRGRMDPNVSDNLESIQAVLGAKDDSKPTGPPPRAQAPGDPLNVQRGRRLAEQRGCLNCHSTEGAQGVGPSWKDLAGTEVTLADGRTLVRDRGYLARAILDPDAEIAAGYPKGLMAGAMPGRKLTQTETEALVLYILSLSGVSPD
ncbi:MAG: redoxin domain-containing protein, partial [Gammaproteobacteria bacterium]